MRDHRKLIAFQRADALALEVYRATERFPREERFGLTAQIRRSAISIPSNIVEGCARHSQSDYLRFLDIACASAKELRYQISLARRLDLRAAELGSSDLKPAEQLCEETIRLLAALQHRLRPRARGL